ncbi:unnamed protein product [Nyctereutes procyonoides]|uniref:(raccoon dog) hypothetical protein n=1 Tax=Nyctereutes procyonoides TaxID=34880 RepID=A0A811ZX13_NYCPR|nr:unnamed protein product [Nyctereutes procyonoides]
MGSVSNQQFAAEEPQLLHGAGICKWFNLRKGFSFLSMITRARIALDSPVDIFVRVTRPGGVFCIGSKRWPKGKNMQKRRSKGDSCPQPKKCHLCQSISHMVASCPLKVQEAPSSQGKPAYFWEEEEEIHSPALLPDAQN